MKKTLQKKVLKPFMMQQVKAKKKRSRETLKMKDGFLRKNIYKSSC